MFGFSSIYVVFDDDVDFYWARSRLLEKLNSLPKELLPQNVTPKLGPDATALGQVFWYTLEGRDENGNVTGGWDLQELRSIQDFYVKNRLAATAGVAEVASVGGFVKEYQIDVDPELLRQYGISLSQVVNAIKSSNRNVGAQTIEINQAEYFVRGLGYVNSIGDIESTSIVSNGYTPITIGQIAKVYLGPAERRGILDKGGAEVVGGVVTARFDANPMVVIGNLKEQISLLGEGLPEKVLNDGRVSKLTLVPFYDRSQLIKETLQTLNRALFFEILIAILVVVVMLRNIRVSIIISTMLPLTVLLVFIAMKLFGVSANIVALSGIAIAIGTVVDMGIILVENVMARREQDPSQPILHQLSNSTKEVSGAILTAGFTTIVSFIPVFALTGAEGKLFAPLAFTKTVALFSAIVLSLFVIPPITALLMQRRKKMLGTLTLALILVVTTLFSVFFGVYWGIFLLPFAALMILRHKGMITSSFEKQASVILAVFAVVVVLTVHWRPLGVAHALLSNALFILLCLLLVLGPFQLFLKKYELLLAWVLDHKRQSIALPILLLALGSFIVLSAEKEFMPTLDEGDFLLMPTSLPHSGVTENARILKKLDMAVSSLPEVEYVVGKAGRAESALDPAPIFMYENLISYKPEYILDKRGKPIRFKVDEDGHFITKTGQKLKAGTKVSSSNLVLDENGSYFRNWRQHIKNEGDIWNEISKVTQLPGVTAAPMLQPIETRLVMLQTGMRSNLGLKIKGQDLSTIDAFAVSLEKVLKKVEGIRPESVFADRMIGKPYVNMVIDRQKLSRFGLHIEDVQEAIEVGVGGKILAYSVEGRERYGIRIRYPRELRNTPEVLESVYLTTKDLTTIPISEVVDIQYERGPQMIKSEDGFLVGYLIFDKDPDISEVTAVNRARAAIAEQIATGALIMPSQVSYEFSGTYRNQLRSQKTLTFIIPLVLLIIGILLYLQFRSVTVSLVVFSGVAVAFAGGFILIWLYGQSWFMNFDLGSKNIRELFNMETVHLSVAVWVGFIALFGIATDDGVILATYLNQAFTTRKPNDVQSIRTTVIEAGKRRIRPCLMTTATTLIALLPVLTATGKGSNIMVPMAIPIFGGMLVALITLFIVPLLYCWRKEILLKIK